MVYFKSSWVGSTTTMMNRSKCLINKWLDGSRSWFNLSSLSKRISINMKLFREKNTKLLLIIGKTWVKSITLFYLEIFEKFIMKKLKEKIQFSPNTILKWLDNSSFPSMERTKNMSNFSSKKLWFFSKLKQNSWFSKELLIYSSIFRVIT